MNRLRSYLGTEQAKLRYLLPSFAESYARAISENAERPFVTWYPADGPRLQKSFSEFDRDVASVRLMLKKLSEDIVVTIEGNTYPHLVHIAAALLESKTLCPLNPADGTERNRAKIAQLAEPAAVLSGPLKIPAASAGTAPLPATMGFQNLKPMVLIFTSGSTGYSKIVEQMEAGILSNVDALIERHKLREPAVIATPLPVFHVNALEFSFFCSLLSGNRLVLFESFQLQQVLQAIPAEKIDIFSGVPNILRILKERAPDELKQLRYVVSAATALAGEVAVQYPVRLIQGYGLSEAVNFSALMPVDLPPDDYRRWYGQFDHPSIGTELEGNSLHILDASGKELGDGETGEICIRGWNVMRGYRGDQTKSVFDGHCLHTGDLGYFKTDEQGRKFFFVAGRIKDVIKRNASTIALAEVDHLLSRYHPNVIAVGFPHDTSGEELAAVVQMESADTAALEKLRLEIETHIPETLRPSVVAATNDPVRSASGKPQRWKFADGLQSACNGKLFGRSTQLLAKPISAKS